MSDKTTTLIVFASPAEGREDDFNDWYDNIHIHEFVALPGVVSGQRYALAPTSPKARTSYAAIYQITAAAADVLKAMDAAIKSGSMRMSDSIDPKSISITAWDPHGAVVTRPAGA